MCWPAVLKPFVTNCNVNGRISKHVFGIIVFCNNYQHISHTCSYIFVTPSSGSKEQKGKTDVSKLLTGSVHGEKELSLIFHAESLLLVVGCDTESVLTADWRLYEG